MLGSVLIERDILRLTALFHARRGRAFLSALSVREGRNYQFDFLRPTHSLFGYYNRMVESYQKVMQPPPGQVAALVQDAADPQTKWNTLEDARKRAGFERHRREREDLRTAQKEEEGKAMAAIDWQDFVVVETIEFTQNDETLELPPPTSADKLRTMSMAEKRMASLVMEETGAGPTGGEANGLAAMEMEEEEEPEEVKLQRIRAEQEQARAREVQRAAMESRGMRIKKDYQTKGSFCRLSRADLQVSPEQLQWRLPNAHTVVSRFLRTSYPSTSESSCSTRNGRNRNESSTNGERRHCRCSRVQTSQRHCEISLVHEPICLETRSTKRRENEGTRQRSRNGERGRRSSGTDIPILPRRQKPLSSSNSLSKTKSRKCTRASVSSTSSVLLRRRD